jgi:hypothetical protein
MILTPEQASRVGEGWSYSSNENRHNTGEKMMEIAGKGKYVELIGSWNGKTPVWVEARSGGRATEQDLSEEISKKSVDHQDGFKTGHVTDPGAEMTLITAGREQQAIKAGKELDKDIPNMSKEQQVALLPKAADSFIKTFSLEQGVTLLGINQTESGLRTRAGAGAKGSVSTGLKFLGTGASVSADVHAGADRDISVSAGKRNTETFSSGMIDKAVFKKASEIWAKDPNHFGENWAKFSQKFANESRADQMKNLGFNVDFQQKTMEEKGNIIHQTGEVLKQGGRNLKGDAKQIEGLVKKVIKDKEK